jgi:hypothetical protein
MDLDSPGNGRSRSVTPMRGGILSRHVVGIATRYANFETCDSVQGRDRRGAMGGKRNVAISASLN